MADTLTTKKVTELTENTAMSDDDLFMVGSAGTASLRRLKWSNIWNTIKTAILGKLVANNLTTTAAGYLLDARQGKALDDKISKLNTDLNNGSDGYVYLPDGTLIQYGFYSGSLTTNSYKNANVNRTFGKEFANTAPVSVMLTMMNSNYLSGIVFDSLTTTGFRAILLGAPAANTSYTSDFRWMAIGRWK